MITSCASEDCSITIVSRGFVIHVLIFMFSCVGGFEEYLFSLFFHFFSYNMEEVCKLIVCLYFVPGMIVTSALIIWKGLMCVTGSESPVVVVLSGSMEPGFKRVSTLIA